MDNIPPKLCLCFPGLNQLYHVAQGRITYSKLYTAVLDELQSNPLLHSCLSKQKSQEMSRVDYVQFKKRLSSLVSSDIVTVLRDSLSQWIKSNVTFVKENHIELLPKEQFTLQVINPNLVHLLIDEAIISYRLLSFSFEYMTRDELIKDITKGDRNGNGTVNGTVNVNGLNYIICSPDIYFLIEMHKLSCWTVLLTNYSYCHNERESTSEEATIVKSLNQYLNDVYSTSILPKGKYIRDEDFNFTSYNFYQLAYYYKLIPLVTVHSEYTLSECIEQLNQIISVNSPIIVLLFVRTICRNKVFLKQRYFISDKNILYKSHLGSSNISLNGHFDLMLTKAVEVKDLMIYSNIFSKLAAYCSKYNKRMVNDISKFPQFVEKDKMNKFLEDFCNDKTTLKICEQYNSELSYPKSLILSVEKFTNKESFMTIMRKNQFSFPLIIKFKGKATFFKHRIAIIFEEKDYPSFLQTISPYIEPDLSIIIQRQVNHGASLLKIYKIGTEMYIDYRSSLPDITPEFKKQFPEGHWLFKTIDLESAEYLTTIWKQFGNPEMLRQTIESNPSIIKFLYTITNTFEHYANTSLFGIDILLDYSKMSFYLIDCNALPGYKIKSINIAEKMRNFFMNLIEGDYKDEKENCNGNGDECGNGNKAIEACSY